MTGSMAIWVGAFVCSLVGLAYGLLSMVSPRTLERVMEWYTGAPTWSVHRNAPRARGEATRRIAGFLITVMMGWTALRLLRGLLRFHTSTSPGLLTAAPSRAPYHWSELLFGAIIILLGIFVIIKPHVLVSMTRANFPNRELSQEVVDKTRRGGRVLGGLAIAFGAFVLLLWYYWTP